LLHFWCTEPPGAAGAIEKSGEFREPLREQKINLAGVGFFQALDFTDEFLVLAEGFEAQTP
jgi:hypothetical protein